MVNGTVGRMESMDAALEASTPVRAPKTAELVAGALRSRIVKGDLAEGQKLPSQATLTRQFHVSRPTLREALRILEVEGLITVARGAHGGARIHSPGTSVVAKSAGLYLQFRGTTIGDVFDARILYEPAAARVIAEKGSKRAIQLLRECTQEERTRLLEPQTLIYLSTRFSKILIEQTENDTIIFVNEMLHDILYAGCMAIIGGNSASKYDPKIAEVGIRAQEKLTNLMEAGKADEAERFQREHLRALGRTLFRGINKKSVVDILSRP